MEIDLDKEIEIKKKELQENIVQLQKFQVNINAIQGIIFYLEKKKEKKKE